MRPDRRPLRLPMSRPVCWLAGTWILCLIALPVARWVFGDAALGIGSSLSVTLQSALVFLLLLRSWRLALATRVLVIIVVGGFVAEAVGSSTGVPFGDYTYTPRLQPQSFGVPWVIPFAWFMMLPPAWAIARAITGKWSGAGFVAVSALAFTAWDLFLDPQMVSWSLWTWTASSGGYFGIPWTNYLGWLLVSAVMTIVARPVAFDIAPFIALYAVTWVLESIGLVLFWDLPGAGLVGFLAMGSLLGLARGTWAPSPVRTADAAS